MTFDDPPRAVAGMSSVVTDDEGRLQILEIVPSQRDPGPAADAAADHAPLFERARRNLRRGVGDRRGAWWLGLALALGGMTALISLALEPYVRRFWPRSLISWTRLLMGRFGDPLVGRDVLIGAVAGILVIVTHHLEWLVPAALGAPPRMPFPVTESVLLVSRGGASAWRRAVLGLPARTGG